MGDVRNVLVSEPYETYERLRAENGNVLWDDDAKAWSVLSFAEGKLVERSEDVFVHPERRDLVESDAEWNAICEVLGGPRALILLQDEQHGRLHRALSRSIAVRSEQHRETTIAGAAERLLTPLVERGHAEFCSEFADLLPTAVIATVLGVPWKGDQEALAQAKGFNDAVADARGSFDLPEENIRRAQQAGIEFNEMLLPTIREREHEPEDDLISEVWAMCREVFPDCRENDVLAQSRMLFFAGSESTGHFLSNAGYLLFTDPALWQHLRADRSLVKRFVEEALRVMGAVQVSRRIADEDTELGGKKICKGDRLNVMSAAANRDPQRFGACPAHVQVDDTQQRGHLAFNVGPRTCPGAALARTEGRVVVELLLDLAPEAHLDPAAPPPEIVGKAVTGCRPLHVVFGGTS